MPVVIKGKEYPIRATMWALLQFKRDKGVNVSDLKADDLDGMLYYTWLCVKGACKQADIVFDLTFEDYVLYVEGDPTEVLIIDKAEDQKKKTQRL